MKEDFQNGKKSHIEYHIITMYSSKFLFFFLIFLTATNHKGAFFKDMEPRTYLEIHSNTF